MLLHSFLKVFGKTCIEVIIQFTLQNVNVIHHPLLNGVVGHGHPGRPELFGEAVQLSVLKLVGQIKKFISNLYRQLPNL